MIDWNAEMQRFAPMCTDTVVIRRTRQLSAAAVRARRYYGTPRGLEYAQGIGRRLAELASVTAVRFDLVSDLSTVRDLLSNIAFGDSDVFVVPRASGPTSKARH